MKQREIHSIHFIGICGTAMGNLAIQMHQMGYKVTGSDNNFYPPISTLLEENKIHVYKGFHKSHLHPRPDLVIIGNAISRGNPEAEAVLDSKLPFMSLPQALQKFFLWETKNIVVTGTHGKTTTASLLAWLLEVSGKKPNFFIGGVPLNFGKGFHFSRGDYFVLEGDEYDTAFFDKRSKFIHYLPDYAIINNIEYDHSDIFPSLEAIKTTFRHFVKIIPSKGLLVANGDDPVVAEIVQPCYSRLETFGFGQHTDWRIESLQQNANGLGFQIRYKGDFYGEFSIPLTGDHNVMNSAAAIAIGHHLGLTVQKIQEGLSTFKSVKRRLEISGEVAGITVYDDFAHHPTAIASTLSGLRRQQPNRRFWAVFEPRTNTTRRNIFQEDLLNALSGADGVAIGKINRAHLIPENERLDRARLCEELKAKGIDAFYDDDVQAIIEWLLTRVKPGDGIVIMSNGGFDAIHGKLLKSLRKQFEVN